jgi:hypothetical protein
LHFSNAASLVSNKATVCRSLVQSVHFPVSVPEISEYRGMLAIGKFKAFAAVCSGGHKTCQNVLLNRAMEDDGNKLYIVKYYDHEIK